MARRVEELGFDTLWFADELLWKVPKWPGPRGFWEAATLAGALAATTKTVKLGSWVFSALHRNPALTVRMAETLDEISEAGSSSDSVRVTPATGRSVIPPTTWSPGTRRPYRS